MQKSNRKPSDVVQAAFQGEYAIVDSNEAHHFVGTFGVGCCLGLALFAKDEKSSKVFAAHIDARTEFESVLTDFITHHSILNACLIGLDSNKKIVAEARKILEQYDIYPHNYIGGASTFIMDAKSGLIELNPAMGEFWAENELPDMGLEKRCPIKQAKAPSKRPMRDLNPEEWAASEARNEEKIKRILEQLAQSRMPKL